MSNIPAILTLNGLTLNTPYGIRSNPTFVLLYVDQSSPTCISIVGYFPPPRDTSIIYTIYMSLCMIENNMVDIISRYQHGAGVHDLQVSLNQYTPLQFRELQEKINSMRWVNNYNEQRLTGTIHLSGMSFPTSHGVVSNPWIVLDSPTSGHPSIYERRFDSATLNGRLFLTPTTSSEAMLQLQLRTDTLFVRGTVGENIIDLKLPYTQSQFESILMLPHPQPIVYYT